MKNSFNKILAVGMILIILTLFSSCGYFIIPSDFSSVELKYENNENRYYYNLLSDNAKIAYTLIMNDIKNHPEKIEIPNLTKDELNDVFLALSYDNPSLLCLGSSSELKFEKLKFYFVPQYSSDVDTCNTKTNELNEQTDSIIMSMPNGMSDYDKELYIHDYICQNCVYDMDCDMTVSSTAYDALIDGKTVCEGYARAAQLLLNELGIYNYLIVGEAVNSKNIRESHMWNIVSIDGENYHLDLTWDDYDEDGKNISHAYFNLNDELVSKNHFMFSPENNNCISTESNFFVKNAILFSDYNSDVDKQIIKQAVKSIKSGNSSIEVMFVDTKYLEKAKKDLIDNSEIYILLDTINKQSKKNFEDVSYTLDESLNVLQFIFE